MPFSLALMLLLILLSVGFLLVTLETELYMPMSGLLAVMSLGGTILKKYDVLASGEILFCSCYLDNPGSIGTDCWCARLFDKNQFEY